MKRIFIMLICTLAVSVSLAQSSGTSNATPSSQTVTQEAVSNPKTDWLKPFDRIKIDGPMKVELKRVAKLPESRIIYDTKGNITSKFKFEIDRKGTLVISERADHKRTTVTEVTVYYTSLRSVKIAHATVDIVDEIERDIFDLSVSGGAIVKLNVQTLDTAVECTGASRLTIGGSSKYLAMRVSTAKVDCSALSTVASIVEASNSAEVRVLVSERLEATTATGAKLLYKGRPVILRDHTAAFGGDIININ